ncbi:hypothetical protein BT63DRAFT_453916 [Microthyrium microscopicum]|uniref:Uncharacterized protein n=1 Tax=Microthyrium microscopicum TaxID=703497 RepID=A0A6A6UIA1_9PEZI|nr:hypothetical protein BT63DRAFT_453916 [Microthyrium microscopicum]
MADSDDPYADFTNIGVPLYPADIFPQQDFLHFVNERLLDAPKPKSQLAAYFAGHREFMRPYETPSPSTSPEPEQKSITRRNSQGKRKRPAHDEPESTTYAQSLRAKKARTTRGPLRRLSKPSTSMAPIRSSDATEQNENTQTPDQLISPKSSPLSRTLESFEHNAPLTTQTRPVRTKRHIRTKELQDLGVIRRTASSYMVGGYSLRRRPRLNRINTGIMAQPG